MKLIATLAALAALVGQTEATDTAEATITAVHNQVGLGHCNDKITLGAVVTGVQGDGDGTSVAKGKKITFKLPDGFALEGTFAVATHITSIKTGTTTLSDGGTTAADGKYTNLAYDATKNEVSYENSGNAADAAAIEVKLKAVCNYLTTATSDAYTYTAKSAEVKFMLQGQDSALVTSSATAVQPTTGAVAELDLPVVSELPTNGATGKLKVTFTGVDKTSGLLQLNLPTGYEYAKDCVCSVGPSDSTVAFDKITSKTATKEFTLTSTKKLTAAASAFECDKITAPSTITTPKSGDMSLRLGSDADTATHAAYFKTVTASPTKSPTAKAADSPASVATASGVVVGALGVAALFLA